MAYQQDFSEEDNKDQPGQTVLSSDNSGAQAAPGSSAPSSGQPVSPQQPGTGFTNLSKYVDANKDQSGQMAGQLTGNIQSDINSASENTNKFKDQASKKVEDATVKDSGAIGELSKSPWSFASDDWKKRYYDNLKGYQAENDASQFEGYQDLSKAYDNIDQKVKNLENPANLKANLKDQYSKSQPYTAGQNTLDAFLTGSGKGRETLNDFSKQYQATQPANQFKDATSKLNSLIGQAKQTSDKTAQDTLAAQQGAVGNYESLFSNLKKQLDTENQAAADKASALKSGVSKRDQAALNEIGLGADTANSLADFGYDLGSLVKGPTQFQSLGDKASDKDIQAYNLLRDLGGQGSKFDFSKSGNAAPGYSVSGDVGTANDFQSLYKNLQDALSSGQSQRDLEYQRAVDATRANGSQLSADQIAANAKLLGLTPENYKFALSNGLLNADQIKKGAALNLGDVANNDIRSKWDTAIANLGLSKAPSIEDIQNEGSSWSIDPKLLSDIEKQAYNKLYAEPYVASLGETGRSKDIPVGQLHRLLPSTDQLTGSGPSNLLKEVPKTVQKVGSNATSAAKKAAKNLQKVLGVKF